MQNTSTINHLPSSIPAGFQINPGTIARINQFKTFIGTEKFDQVCQGIATVEIPLEEDRFTELMQICLDQEPECGFAAITYTQAEEILSFFCKPFAGSLLKQAKSTLAGISSLLHNLDPAAIKIMMESITSRMSSGTNTDASSLQTEIPKQQKEFTIPTHQSVSQN